MSGQLNLGDDWRIIGTDGGDYIVEHADTGNEIRLKDDGTLGTSAIDTDRIATKSGLPDAVFYKDGSTYYGVSKTDTTLAATADADSAWSSIMSSLSDGDRLEIAAATYQFSEEPTISNSLKVSGAFVGTTNATFAPDVGVIFEQQTAGNAGLVIDAQEKKVDLENIGITWASSPANSDTGHGVHCDPPSDGNGHYENSIQNSTWKNIFVTDHDGDHYAFYFKNAILCDFRMLRGRGGGGMAFENDTSSRHNGNITTRHTHIDKQNSGSAHGHFYDSQNQQINIIHHIYPSIRKDSTGDSAQPITYNVNGSGTDTKVARIQYWGANDESSGDNLTSELPDGGFNYYQALFHDPDVTLDIQNLSPYGTGNDAIGGSLDTWYQNDSRHPRYVHVILEHDGTQGDTISASLDVNSSQSTNAVDSVVTLPAASGGDDQRVSLSGFVPRRYYFQVRSFSNGTVRNWAEVQMTP